tara:strand:- start:229 stop:504 length:276 start_codon:yes stop_codon:yes gene_type:complete
MRRPSEVIGYLAGQGRTVSRFLVENCEPMNEGDILDWILLPFWLTGNLLAIPPDLTKQFVERPLWYLEDKLLGKKQFEERLTVQRDLYNPF